LGSIPDWGKNASVDLARPLMLDLCAGLGGASAAFVAAGWDVVTLDFDSRFGCTITDDLAKWSWSGRQVDFIWASPPCTEFSRESMPWCRTGVAPDMTLVRAVYRVVAECLPRLGWVLENVRGAVPFLGSPRAIVGPFYLWGDFPSPGRPVFRMKHKQSYSSRNAAERAKIPYALSAAVELAVSSQSRIAVCYE